MRRRRTRRRGLVGGRWRVRRTGGLLVPGFSKRMRRDGSGTTFLWGVPVGAFDVDRCGRGGGIELRYRRWPIVDELHDAGDGTWHGRGRITLPGRRRLTFCTFRLARR